MTFPSAVKKSGSKTLPPGSPRSPSSPLNAPTKLTSPGSSVKTLGTKKAPDTTNVSSSVNKVSIPPKNSVSKSVSKCVDAKPEPAKIALPSSKRVTKTVTKPPPLQLNIKLMDANELPSPLTPKSVPKTPTTPSVRKSLVLTKSPIATKPVLNTKSPASIGLVKIPSSVKSSQASVSTGTKPSNSSFNKLTAKSAVSSSVIKSSSISVSSKSSVVISVAKSSTSDVSKNQLVSSSVSKSPVTPSKHQKTDINDNSTPSSLTKSKTAIVKPTTPVKKTTAISTKSVSGVKLPTTPTSKSLILSRSPSTASSLKSISLKTPNSPSKLLAEESNVKKILTTKPAVTASKSSVVSKSESISSKVMVRKESSTLSLLSTKSSSVKSTSQLSKTKVTPSSVSKNLVAKSPILKTTLTVKVPESPTMKVPSLLKVKVPSSPTVKVPSSPTVKVPSSPTVKKVPSSPTVKVPSSPLMKVPSSLSVKVPSSPTVKVPSSPSVKVPSSPIIRTSMSSTVKIPLSPAVKVRMPLSPRTTSLSIAKPPMSPRPKLLPTKLLLSPKKNKLQTSKSSSVSTESLGSKTLKSPISPRPIKSVPKSPSKIIKKTEALIVKSIRGGQPIKKTTDILEKTELPSNNTVEQNMVDIECDFINVSKEIMEPSITQMPDQHHEQLTLEMSNTVVDDDDDVKIMNQFVFDNVSLNISNEEQIEKPLEVLECQELHLETIKDNCTVVPEEALDQQKLDEDNSISLDFVVVTKEECVPHLNSISKSSDNCDIKFDDNHFDLSNENTNLEQCVHDIQSCIIDVEDNFEPMNDKLILGDVPFETDSCQSDVSDNEQVAQKETVKAVNCDELQKHDVDNVFSFTEDILVNNIDKADESIENFIHQFMPKSMERSEGTSSISTDDGSFFSRKSYSEAVVGSPKDSEYFEYNFDLADDCLDYDDERSVFVEITDKEFPELKPKDLSGKKKSKKQKKRNYSNRTESQSDSITSEIHYNPEEFNGSEFCHYIKMMKDCSFYPNGLFSSDSVKLSSSSSLSWLDISVRTTDDDLSSSTESLSNYEIFQASNLSKEFLTSIIGSNTTTSNETSWFWKSIEGRHQSLNKTNITLSLQPRPKHLTTPRFMTLLALISEAKGYAIKPSLSENFVTTDCMLRFDEKIGRLMVQGFWLVGRLIKESLSENTEMSCENPFDFVDGDIGFWWAGINMLDWQEYLKECDKNSKILPNCYQFVLDNINENNHIKSNALSSMNVSKPDDFMSELDVENFIHTVRNVKYYCGNIFVDSEESLEKMNDSFCDDESIVEWENNFSEQHQ